MSATSNTNDDGSYKQLDLSLSVPGDLADSGLSFETGYFSPETGVVRASLTGRPESFTEDTEFTIKVKATEATNASYNNERTLTIKILQDPIYVSPAT